MSDFTHVKPGDKKIKARSFNTLLDLGRLLQTQMQNRGKTPGIFDVPYDSAIINVANISDAEIEPGQALALIEPLILPADNEAEFIAGLVMKADIPSAANAGKFCIVLEPLPPKYEDASSEEKYHIGRAVVAGLAPARINIVNDFHKWADVTDDSSSADPVLQSDWTGSARIIWKDEASGGEWAVVLLGQRRPDPIFVRLEEDGGGEDGDEDYPPTYTYIASDEDGNEIATDLSPSHTRPLGQTHPANFGWLLINPPNDPDLLVTDERPNFGECQEGS